MGIRRIQRSHSTLRAVGSPRITFPEALFHSCHGVTPFPVQHDLVDHPLFDIERLASLAASLPAHRVEWNAGDLPASVRRDDVRSNGLSAVETLRSIHRCGSWIVLKHVQLDRDYARLLHECLSPIQAALGVQGLSLSRPVGFIFVSSPGATTPCHLDPESNFLLQVRGTKSISTLPRLDPRFVLLEELERFTVGGDRHVQLEDSALAEAVGHELSPGDGLHVPIHAPHFVVNGPAVSVSFSLTFQTEATDRERGVLWMNHRLRSLGLEPTPPGTSNALDLAKLTLFKGLRSARRVLRRNPPPS
ncbi:transcription factor [Planctomycetes bacterium Poly30]|uniref:transcription factor n=1 Tax=Saltatorellus ferox TaxID=2528018 RepID=UPI00119D114A